MNFEMIEIESVEKTNFTGKVYDLEVEEDHSYNVNGILVHNSDFVMIGSMFAGHDESGGDEILKWEKDGYMWKEGSVTPNFVEKKYKEAYGMSSKKANEKYSGGLASYRSSEGREVQIPYKGSIEKTVRDIKGSVSSTMTYIGARRLKDIPKCATFVKVYNTHNLSLHKYEN